MDREPPAVPSPAVWIGEGTDVADAVAADIEREARRRLEEQGRFSIAIPGGSVAVRCFPRLPTVPIDWSAVDVFWVDERAVPPADGDSNYRLAWDLWLRSAGGSAPRVHRMRGEADDLERAARDYAEVLAGVTGTPPRLDYVLLGVGSDGHVASLFPGHVALSRRETVLAVQDSPRWPPRRLSLSLAVLAGARRLAIVAFGVEKASVIQTALTGASASLPVALVTRRAASCIFLLDREAGRLVGRGS